MGEERADYMMEAFLDEQNTLIRPLVARKLNLVKVLDERAAIIEKILDDARKKFLHAVVGTVTPTKRTMPDPPGELERIEKLEDDLEQLCEEKVNVLLQLNDLVRRPYDTILEVESVLQSAADREPEDGEGVTGRPGRHARTAVAAWLPVSSSSPTSAPMELIPSPPEEELWCFCRKPDDGRQMVACDNPKCDLVWWHIDCIDRYVAANRIGGPPGEDSSKKWNCPVCLAQEIVNREEHANGGGDKRRRRASRA